MSGPSPQQLADWLKEYCGPFPYGDHISLTKEETEEQWLFLGERLHEFIASDPETVERDWEPYLTIYRCGDKSYTVHDHVAEGCPWARYIFETEGGLNTTDDKEAQGG